MDNNRTILVACAVSVIFSLITTCNSCSTNTKIKIANEKVDSLTTAIKTNDIGKALDKTMIAIEIEGYEISRRMLYDNNYVVRTHIRPEDIMWRYSMAIDSLRNSLNK